MGSLAALALPYAPAHAGDLDSRFADIEASTGGRLGVVVFDAHGVQRVSYRPGERFPMCSTFKVLAVGDVLTQADAGSLSLERRVQYTKADLLSYAPITRRFVGRGWMTVRELCAATISLSDNSAVNLLLEQIGGPPGLTRYVRTLGDRFTRLDRIEPFMSSGIPGDPRDTTTPEAMGFDVYRLLLKNVLSANSRALLIGWLRRSTTGLNLLRAGFPPSWRVGDKTGLGGQLNAFGDSSTRNDVAIVWPPGHAPFIVSAYLTGAKVAAVHRDAALAEVGRTVAGLW
jgi:beta-lactamase class A